ncbi:B-cell receptor CD22-like [Erpetoichthys calabaricus]|uniref:B-cell receptor CD22 n=1 Tax=Erpetoichthys calabaricus TaxID=27687 RepID=A0A8C4TBF4_ERPCA|nr:B-cell receptor CD22-like [Erpetoichthys calabaricus]
MFLLMFLVASSCAVDVSRWKVNYQATQMCILEGSTVGIVCSYTPPPGVVIRNEMWFYGPDKEETGHNNETLVYHTEDEKVSAMYRNRVEFSGNKNTVCSVKISNVSREDSGYYKFRIEGTSSWTEVPGVHITVTGVTVEATAEKVKENESVTLTCKINCNLPGSQMSWYRNGQQLQKTSGKLKIERASDASYSCRVEHLASPEFLLNVEYTPRDVVITGQANMSIEEGTSVTLNCTALANPPSSYSWVKENSSHVGSGEQLHISSVNTSHAGSYYCEATNIHGTTKSAAVNLTVNVKHIADMSLHYVLYVSLIIIVLSGFTLALFIFSRKRAKKTNQQIRASKMDEGMDSCEDHTYASLDRIEVSSDYETILQKQ